MADNLEARAAQYRPIPQGKAAKWETGEILWSLDMEAKVARLKAGRETTVVIQQAGEQPRVPGGEAKVVSKKTGRTRSIQEEKEANLEAGPARCSQGQEAKAARWKALGCR